MALALNSLGRSLTAGADSHALASTWAGWLEASNNARAVSTQLRNSRAGGVIGVPQTEFASPTCTPV